MNIASIKLPTNPVHLIAAALIICLVSSYSTYTYIKINYIEVHPSEVGGFVFQKGKVYNLCEINGLDVKLSVAKPTK